ncbi:MAG: AraC family ligand binding domain-containing protein [Oscillospiraceae bacterium]
MNNSIYPVLGAQMKLPFYVSGVGISDPEYHVVRSSGLVSYQILYTRSGAGVLEIDGRKLPQIPGSIFLVAPGVPHEYYPQQGMGDRLVFSAGIRELMTNLGFGDWNERSGTELRMRWDLCKAAFRSVRLLNGGERCSLLVYEYILRRARCFSAAQRREVSQTARWSSSNGISARISRLISSRG